MIFHGYLSYVIKGTGGKSDLIAGQDMLIRLLGKNATMRKKYASSHHLLGRIYENEEKYPEATEEYLIAEKLYSNIQYHSATVATDDVSQIYTRLACTYAKLNDNKMAQYYLDLHRKRFNYNHTRNNEIMECMIKQKMPIAF